MPHVKHILPTPAQQAGDDPSELPEGHHVVGNSNRWSRTVFSFKDLTPDTWCEFNFQLEWHADEESRSVTDFAVIGVDFLTEDGSNIDFTSVPGLTRTQIDPHSFTIPGPDYHSNGSHIARAGKVCCTFLVPSPARHLLITIRSWRNSHEFRIVQPKLCQRAEEPQGNAGEEQPEKTGHIALPSARRNWRNLSSEPHWFTYSIVPERPLFIRGQVINQNADSSGALARVVFRNAQGQELPPPYPEMLFAPGVGAVIKIPTHKQVRRFTLELMPPPQAASVDLGFQTWRDEALMELVLPLEVSLEDDLLLENITGEDTLDALGFMGRLMDRIGAWSTNSEDGRARTMLSLLDHKTLASSVTLHERIRNIQRGDRQEVEAEQLILGTFPAWPIPTDPTWTEDPFRSSAWRMEFQSLSWLLSLSNEQASAKHAVELALSWSRLNPLGSPSDVLSGHPSSVAARGEVFLRLLALTTAPKSKTSPGNVLALFAEVVRHCFVLSQIIGQNVLTHSISQLHAAGSLFVMARAIPNFPLAPYWASLALAHLQDGFDAMIAPEGATVEQSQHYRLEALSLGLILLSQFDDGEDLREIRQRLAPKIKDGIRTVIATTDPAGMLPLFGDTLHKYHHAAWIRRLLSGYGKALMADEAIIAELTYPEGSRLLALPEAGVIVARHYRRQPNWSYFCASFGEQRQAHGHFDCTSFVYSAAGVRWITDPGGSSLYETGAVRQYLISSRAHNVAIPDGREQTAGYGWIKSTSAHEGANIVEIGTNVHGPSYAHRRVVICLDNLSAIAVFDQFETAQRTMSFEGFLHLDTAVTAALVNPKLVVGFKGRSRLRILPRTISGTFNGIRIESGSSERPAALQGFISRSPGSLEPANVVRYTFSGQQTVCGGAILAVDEAGLRAMAQLLDTTTIKDILERSPVS